ncbi:HSP90 family protein [Microbacterium sp. cf332]|uniref:HSP90 family protein n=1 Tax=Microbacterium sp. cf332 TaxID=1761804 RepID=UPI00088137B9|nr:HSP90 family protein [Microbacterium sp. cf332]SDQ24679.1 molecular chaperone HtpG [Microbacterium sp. cf332]
MDSGRSQQFQVDLRGIVDLLSRHIYSGPRVFLRELMQNACDAITARAELDADASPSGLGRESSGIRITPLSDRSDEFVVRDDGIGLTESEVTELLATVGRSSKRDIFDLPRSDFLGQFGIGLLACFMVAETIVIRSRSARGGDAVEWRGNADGTFTVTTVADDLPVGTSVHLRPRPGHRELLSTAATVELAETFGEFLPIPVRVDLPAGGERLTTRTPAFRAGAGEVDEAARWAYGRDLLGQEPFDVIPLRVPGTDTVGTAYVLPFAPPPGARQATRVYLGRMLLSENADDILPPWAFFVRAVIDSTALRPTASRESLVEDDALEHTREQLGAAIRRWVLDLGLTEPQRLAQFVAIHEVALKSLVRHDDELAAFIVRWLSVETTHGRMRVGDLVGRHSRIRYVETVDEYRQVAGIADPREPLVNGGYLYDAELVRLFPLVFDGVAVEHVDVLDELDRLDPPPLDDRERVLGLEARATAALATVGCTVVVRSIDTDEIPAVYLAGADALRAIDRSRARSVGSPLWGSVMDRIDATAQRLRPGAADEAATTGVRLCLNWKSPVTRSLLGVPGDDAFARTVHLLYVQALLAAQRPLSGDDRVLMTNALRALVELSARPSS